MVQFAITILLLTSTSALAVNDVRGVVHIPAVREDGKPLACDDVESIRFATFNRCIRAWAVDSQERDSRLSEPKCDSRFVVDINGDDKVNAADIQSFWTAYWKIIWSDKGK